MFKKKKPAKDPELNTVLMMLYENCRKNAYCDKCQYDLDEEGCAIGIPAEWPMFAPWYLPKFINTEDKKQ